MFRENTSVFKKMKEAFHPTPLRRRIVDSLFKLNMQLRRLENASYKMQERDRRLYEKCTQALQSKDNSLANMYASECAEIRKITKVILHSHLALEQVTLRLETVKEFGDVASVMTPVVGIVRIVKNQLSNVLPEVSLQLAEVDDSLRSMVMEIGDATEQSFDLSPSNEDAQRILKEANAVAEQKMQERFPELPSIPSHEARV